MDAGINPLNNTSHRKNGSQDRQGLQDNSIMSVAKPNASIGGHYEYETGNLLLTQNKTLDTNPSTGEFLVVEQLSASPLPFTAEKSTNYHNSYL